MAGFLIPFAVATVLGFLAGMGVGGGSLLLLWLTQVAKLPHDQARILNLLFFLPAALIATLLHRKQHAKPGQGVTAAIVAGCAAAAIFSFISRSLDITLLKKLLGGLLILTGLREIFYRPRKAR